MLVAVLCAGVSAAWGEDFTLSSADEVTQNGVTVSFNKGEGSYAPTWYSAGLRLYAKNTITISSTKTIQSITFNWEKQGSKEFASVTANTGNYSHPTTTGSGTWSGTATSVTFTLGSSGQLQLNTLSVIVEGETPIPTCATPTFSPAEGTYESVQDVSISTTTQGATIYYTTDGTTPTTGSTKYINPINVSTTTTVKAIAVKEGNNNSAVATATYTINLPYTGGDYVRVSSLGYLTDGAKVIIAARYNSNVTDYYAMTASASGKPTGVFFSSITSNNGEILPESIVNSESTYYWIVKVTSDGYQFTNAKDQVLGYKSSTNFAINSNTVWAITRATSGNSAMVVGYEGFYITTNNAGRGIALNDQHNYGPYATSNNNSSDYNFYVDIFVQGATPANDPSISASDVELEHNATSGSIAYTVDNEVTGGNLTASTNSDWLTLGNEFTSPIAFTCSANQTAAPRTAEVILTYTYNTSETVTKTVTITQAANPDVIMTIANVRAQGTGDVQTKGVVTSVYGKTAYIQDANAAIAVRGNDDLTVAVGNEIKVSGTLGVYSGLLQIQNPTITVLSQNNSVTPEAMTVGQVNASTNQGWLVKIEEATVTTIDGQNVTIAEGENTVVVRFNTTPSGFAINDKLTLTGNISCYGETKQIANPTVISVIESAEPLITVDPTSINATYDGEEGNISVTYDNVDTDAIEIVFYTTAEATTTTTYSWIDAIFDEMNNVQYTIDANEGEARTAYMKIHGHDGNGNDVYSDLITISQGAQPTTEEYDLFSGDLVEGDYIIYYNGKAMNTTVTNNRLGYEEVTPSNNIITTDNAAIVWHIAKSGNYWTIYNAAEGKYAAATGTKNQATVSETLDDKALWTVTGSEAFDFVNKHNTSNKVNANLRNNGTYGFACYAEGTGGALSLYKKVETVTIDEADYVNEAYVPIEKYANVTFKRTLVEGWNGLVVPFDMTVEEAKTKFKATAVKDFTGVTYDAEKGATLVFSNATEIKAGKPFMIKATAAGTQYTFEGVQLKSDELQAISLQADEGEAKYTMTGTYQKVDLKNENFVLIQGNKYYQHNTNKESSAKAFRAYFVNESTGEALSKGINVNFDGEATGIELVENGQFANNQNGVYNLQGQKVNNAQKGVYIVNGKKIVVK